MTALDFRSGCAALALTLALAGCGYVGEPMPPALSIPLAVSDLRAVQRGDKLLVDFTIPPRTTEGLEVGELRDVELRAGPGGPPPFQIDRWAAGARKVDVSQTAGGAVSVAVAVNGFANQEVFLAVRAQGAKKRWSGWSNIVALPVVPPVPVPSQVAAESTAAGVRLTWAGQGAFRVFRRAAGEKEFTRIATSDQPRYVDATAAYGTAYEYAVQATVKSGSAEAESEPSLPTAITPDDKFPPAVPAGLNALAGAGSVQLVWDRDTDSDLAGYFVYRAEGEGPFTRQGARVDAPSYSDRTVQSGKRYRYRVSAVDLKGNESAQGPPVEIVAP